MTVIINNGDTNDNKVNIGCYIVISLLNLDEHPEVEDEHNNQRKPDENYIQPKVIS